jgi:hypothetical protein
MGYAARSRERVWIGLYRLPWWWRLRVVVRGWRVSVWRRVFRGGLLRWLAGRRRMPAWLLVRADHLMIREAQRVAARAAEAARGGRTTR